MPGDPTGGGPRSRERHHLLDRQLRRLGLHDAPPDRHTWELFLDGVDNAYSDADRGRELLERSLDLSSAEMRTMYDELQRSTESKVAFERDRLSAVFNAVTTGLLVIDRRGIIAAVNPEAARLVGSPVEVIGRFVGDVLFLVGRDGEPRPLVDAAELEAAMHSSRWSRTDVRIVGQDGEPVPTDCVVVPYRDHGEGSILGALVVVDDNTEREAVKARLAWQATHDPLTGLPNRELFTERLEQAMVHARRTGEWPAVLFLDLDRFKHVNDSLGHAKGDHLLCAASERLQRALRATDTVARMGGDEFVVLCEGSSSEQAALVLAERIVASLNEPFDLDGEQAFVTTSIGIAHGSQACQHADDLLHDADVAMYRAKEGGRNRVEVADEAMRAEATERVLLERGLRYAVNNGELHVAYQPIRRTEDGHLVAFEALARWSHPVLGDVAPERFIPLAEEVGLINVLGDRLLEIACRDARSWHDESAHDIAVHVNVSSTELVSASYLDRLHDALERHGLPARLLALEVTEGVLLDNPDRALERLEAIRGAGVQVAIDDFGTGYSSLAYLRRFPLHVVKIDREFVCEIDASLQNQRIVRAIVDLAHGLGYDVLAEGVETQGELDTIRELGCELAQGHHLGVPVAPEEALLMASITSTRRGPDRPAG